MNRRINNRDMPDHQPEEIKMNREFGLQPKALRGLFACAAVFATLAVVASIDLLSRHYGAGAQFATAAKSVTVVSITR
jgi:hypothetical protein